MDNDSSSRIAPYVFALHFYAALILGSLFYHQQILPLAISKKLIEPANFAQIQLYLLHALAFSALIYLIIRPIVRLVAEALCALEGAIQKLLR